MKPVLHQAIQPPQTMDSLTHTSEQQFCPKQRSCPRQSFTQKQHSGTFPTQYPGPNAGANQRGAPF